VCRRGIGVTGLPSLLKPRGDTADEDLAALQGAWAGTYDIGFDGPLWHANCLHGIPLLLTAKTPAGLAAAMSADWIRRGARGDR
jgi:hypothetical protein